MALAPEEKAVLVSNLNSLVEDPTCRVDTSSITSGDPTAGSLPTSATEACTDDDSEVQKIFGDGPDVSCVSAAASGMCAVILANSPLACTCSCPTDGSGPVCQNDDAGLQEALGDDSFTCTSAATSGMCSVVQANAPGMCGCSCPDDDDGHRRQMGEAVCTPQVGLASIAGSEHDSEESVSTGVITSDSTDLELMHDEAEQVVGIYFPEVHIAPGTVIDTASIVFDVDEVRPGQSDQKVMISIFGERNPNPAPLTATAFDLSDRTTTTAGEMWTPASSGSTHEELATSDISPILNEIISLRGWRDGNPMVILFGHFAGRGVRWVEAARENNGVMTPALRWTTRCSSGMLPTDAVVDLMDGPPQFLPHMGIYFSPTCPLDSIDNALYAVSAACCTDLTPCMESNQGVPEQCTFDCNRVFTPFMTNCRDTITALVTHSRGQETVHKLDTYSTICSQFSVASMATAIYEARCGVCGDESVDDWLAEQCDAGAANADTPDAPCRTDCMLPRCGDGVQDSTEGCDEGEANAADGSCGVDCQPTCDAPDPRMCGQMQQVAEWTDLETGGPDAPQHPWAGCATRNTGMLGVHISYQDGTDSYVVYTGVSWSGNTGSIPNRLGEGSGFLSTCTVPSCLSNAPEGGLFLCWSACRNAWSQNFDFGRENRRSSDWRADSGGWGSAQIRLYC
jgi:hypothetical protein